MKEIKLSEIEGFYIGHAQDYDAVTGCTAIICPEGAVSGVDIRGGGPATRETALLDADKNTHKIHSVVFSGGSAFGLEAANGVMDYLEEKGIGYKVRTGIVPLVSAACIFDLTIGKSDIRPDKTMGYLAASSAMNAKEESVKDEDRQSEIHDEKIKFSDMQGNIGAGTGATVGKLGGPKYMMKSGLGTYAVEHEGIKVGAIAIVNALGDIIEDGDIIAGMLNPEFDVSNTKNSDKEDIFADSFKVITDRISQSHIFDFRKENTTLVCVMTNCDVGPHEAQKIAQMACNGLPRVIYPVNTSADGDAVFSMNKGDKKGNIASLGVMASSVVREAILKAVKETEGICDIPSIKDISVRKENK